MKLQFKNFKKLFNYRWNRNDNTSQIAEHLSNYPAPVELNFNWGYGALSGFFLLVQLLSGFLLTMRYTAETKLTLAFDSIQHIAREANSGLELLYVHSNGASFFLAAVYCHIARSLFYGSYASPRGGVWVSGVFIFILLMATAFLGYILPWGQMSFWGATVITNLLTAIPKIGLPMVQWLWGGFSVESATLTRFYTLHFFLPFVIAGLAGLHIILLHRVGSSSPLGTESKEPIRFGIFYLNEDLFTFFAIFIIYTLIFIRESRKLGHADNFIKANPMVTPEHIVPEWYFLPFYAILRSIPDKALGVATMGGAIGILFLLPVFSFLTRKLTKVAQPTTGGFSIFCFFSWLIFIFNFILLGWLGAQVAEEPFVTASRVCTGIYFFYFCVPFLGEIFHSIFLTNKTSKRSGNS